MSAYFSYFLELLLPTAKQQQQQQKKTKQTENRKLRIRLYLLKKSLILFGLVTVIISLHYKRTN